jgi:hypothetical protein
MGASAVGYRTVSSILRLTDSSDKDSINNLIKNHFTVGQMYSAQEGINSAATCAGF